LQLVIDIETVREHYMPGSTYVIDCGGRVADLREKANISRERLAADCGVTATTIRSIEAGKLLPRDYLRALIAFNLGKDPDDIWPTLTRRRIKEMAA